MVAHPFEIAPWKNRVGRRLAAFLEAREASSRDDVRVPVNSGGAWTRLAGSICRHLSTRVLSDRAMLRMNWSS